MKSCKPEGFNLARPENRLLLTVPGLARAFKNKLTVEAPVLYCDDRHTLFLDIPGVCAYMPAKEVEYSDEVRPIAILTRVGKPVCFKITELDLSGEQPVARLSRADAQKDCIENYVDRLEEGDVIEARVTHIEPFGAFCDVGCGVVALLPVDRISISRISSPSERLFVGMTIKAAVLTFDRAAKKITLSMRELLGTFMENAGRFSVGTTVRGIVRTIRPFGIFIELAPNLSGLAEPKQGVEIGNSVCAYIKSASLDRMKIKLAIVDYSDAAPLKGKLDYFITGGHITRWRYSPEGCGKVIETRFGRGLNTR